MEDSPLKQKATVKAKDNTKEVDQLKKQIQAAKGNIKDSKDRGDSPPMPY